jgi:ubiquinone/menaquinone biosynthesis C-methylase UbiE
MPDVFSDITNAPADVLDAILDTLEKRAADPRLQAMLDAYLSEIELPNSARVLEVGSGTGPVARRLARIEQAQRVIGLDPSPVFLAKAHELAHGIDNLDFQEGDGRSLPFDDATFDLVVLHTLLCHVPEPETVLRESHRVLKPGATLAVFDCDFSTASLSTGDFDPFQTITDVMVDSIVHDRWFVRKMRGHLKNCGFEAGPLRSYAYSEHPEPSFMFTWIERGAAALIASGRLGEDGAAALRAEAERRVQQEQWYGYVSYASVISRKPA